MIFCSIHLNLLNMIYRGPPTIDALMLPAIFWFGINDEFPQEFVFMVTWHPCDAPPEFKLPCRGDMYGLPWIPLTYACPRLPKYGSVMRLGPSLCAVVFQCAHGELGGTKLLSVSPPSVFEKEFEEISAQTTERGDSGKIH